MATDQAAANGPGAPESDAARAAFPRFEQTFPTLTETEIDRMRRFGEVRQYKDGERHGSWTRWWANGQKREEGWYKDGKRVRKRTCWDEAGKEVTCPK